MLGGVHSIFISLMLLMLGAFCILMSAVPSLAFQIYASNNPPFNYQDDKGDVQGIAVDILKTLMERTYKPVHQGDISIINWARAVEYTWTTDNKVLLSPARTPKREDMFAWVGPLHSFKLGLIARKDSMIRIESPEDVKKYKIGVIRESAPAQILQRQFGVPLTDMTELAKDEQLFLMLDRGRVDLIPRGVMSASFWLERLGKNPDDYEMVYVLKELDLYMGFSPSADPELIHRLNLEFMRMKEDRPDGTNEYYDIIHRHVHGEPVEVR